MPVSGAVDAHLPERLRTGYTLVMQLGGILIRVVLALWLCVGTQVHVAMDHASLFQHGTHPLTLSQAASNNAPHIAHNEALCCYHTPQHQHHENGAPHAHMAEALPSSSAKRGLNTLDAAQIPTRVFVPETCAAPAIALMSVSLPAEAPDTCNAALRAPPSA